MKQIKSILLLALGVMFAAACSSSSDSEPTTTTQDVAFVSYEASQTQVTLNGLTKAVDTDNIENPVNWVTVAPQNYSGSGAPTVMISVTENESQQARSAIVTIKDKDKNTAILNISQPAYQPRQLSLGLTMSGNAAEEDFTLDILKKAIKSIDYSATWLSVQQNAYTSGAPSVKITVQANPTADPREATVSIIATNGDQLTLTVTQEGKISDSIEDIHNTETDQPAYSRKL